MQYRITLTHATLGTKVISPPDGWPDVTLRLERHEQYHSLFEQFEGEFWFYGSNNNIDGGLEFILEAEQLDGPDVTIDILAELSLDDLNFTDIFAGQLLIPGMRKTQDNKALIPVVRNDFSVKFKNRVDTPVDIQSAEDLDGNDATVFENVTLELISQIINKTNTYDGAISPDDEVFFQVHGNGTLIDFDGATDGPNYRYTQAQVDLDQEEIDESADTLLDFVSTMGDVPGAIEVATESGPMSVNIQPHTALVTFFALLGDNRIGDYGSDPSQVTGMVATLGYFVTVNDVIQSPVFGFTYASASSGPITNPVGGGVGPVNATTVFSIDVTEINFPVFNVVPGDTVKLIARFGITISIDVGTDSDLPWNSPDLPLTGLNPEGTYLKISSYHPEITVAFKSSYKDTAAESFLVHDVAGQILDRTIGRENTFYSEYFGSDRTRYRQYDADGCAWEHILSRGLQLRQYTLTDKPFFQSFTTWWNGVNPIFNLGLGYETIDGVEVMRCEEKEHFYNETIIVYISNVREITRAYDEEVMIKTFRAGYKKWQSENFSGIDDPQTKHTYASRLQKSGKDLTMESEFIAASLAIETTRRTTKQKSADYKFDDDTFIIAVRSVETSPDATYIPETDEKFQSVTNLLNPETRYNLLLTPARNTLRWLKWIAGGLQNYVGSFLKFVSGEGNYDMTSNYGLSDGCDEYDGDLSEKQDLEVTDDYIHRGEVYEMRFKLEFEDYLTIRDNRKNAIGISQTDSDHKAFFIKNLEYKLFDGVCTLTAWPKEFYENTFVESSGLAEVCYPVSTDCDNAYTTEDEINFETESGACLVLN
jgi:hypothetical protein